MKGSLLLFLLLGLALTALAGPPVIISAPQPLTINAGSAADFSVMASNAVSYQWVWQGTNIAGATNAEYSFDNVSTNQAGLYWVIVRSSDTAVSNSDALTVVQGTIVNFSISGFAGGSSNVVVELFDHDKPATVENFVHYIRSGAYSNMFFDRLITGFVLQGGDWFAANRTSATPPPQVGDIYQNYVLNSQVQNPPLPQQVDSEFYAGPRVSNKQGTVAMSLPSGNVDGAANAFFFNLVDNPFLDVYVNGGGPFTVFGRVLSGTNVLQYFNNTNKFFKPGFATIPTNNIFTNGIYDQIYLASNATSFTDLPVNYHGASVPADTNLFFVDFTFPNAGAQPVIDTTLPTAAVTYPPANVILTNGVSLLVQGTAQDNIGLARVYCSLIPQNGAYGGLGGGGNATGTANWGLFFGVIEPGIYNILVTPQDGAGNLGSAVVQPMTISAVLTNGVGTVALTNLSNGSTGNAVGANMLNGITYTLGAQPGAGQQFLNWQAGGATFASPNLTVQMAANLVLTATFKSNNLPAGSIAFTYPAAHAQLTNGTFSIQGSIANVTSAQIICQLFSYANFQAVGPALQTGGVTQWSVNVTNLLPGQYLVQALAVDPQGRTTVITNDFTVLTPFTFLTNSVAFGSGHFGFNLTGPLGQLVVVDASTNLLNWLPIWTNTFGAGALPFSDPQAGAYRNRFYRARLP